MMPHQPADIIAAAGGAADEADVPYRGAGIDITEQTNIIGRGAVDGQAGDGVAEAVENAGECGVENADRREARVAVPCAGAGGVDVGAQDVYLLDLPPFIPCRSVAVVLPASPRLVMAV